MRVQEYEMLSFQHLFSVIYILVFYEYHMQSPTQLVSKYGSTIE